MQTLHIMLTVLAMARSIGALKPMRAMHTVAKLARSSAAVEKEMNKKRTTEPLDLNPPRGTRDFYPENLRVREWLFNKWRESSKAFGFEEYDACSGVDFFWPSPRKMINPLRQAPVLESEALYVRKAGEEVCHACAEVKASSMHVSQVTQQLYGFVDKGGRRVALRCAVVMS